MFLSYFQSKTNSLLQDLPVRSFYCTFKLRVCCFKWGLMRLMTIYECNIINCDTLWSEALPLLWPCCLCLPFFNSNSQTLVGLFDLSLHYTKLLHYANRAGMNVLVKITVRSASLRQNNTVQQSCYDLLHTEDQSLSEWTDGQGGGGLPLRQ